MNEIEFTCKRCGLTFIVLPRNMKKHNKNGLCDLCNYSLQSKIIK